jgi:hypothetical protein
MTLLADLVRASNDVASTSSHSRKIAILAHLLRRLEPSEVTIAAGFLSGLPRQGRSAAAARRSAGSSGRPRGDRR